MATITSKIVWLIALLKTFGLEHNQAASLYYGRKAAIYIDANPVFHQRTKHIEIDCHFIREKIQDGVIKTFHVPTRHQIVDFFTKALGHKQFHYLLSKMNLVNMYSSSWTTTPLPSLLLPPPLLPTFRVQILNRSSLKIRFSSSIRWCLRWANAQTPLQGWSWSHSIHLEMRYLHLRYNTTTFLRQLYKFIMKSRKTFLA